MADPLTLALVGLKTIYGAVLFGIQIDQCPDEVRRALELVSTLHADLQDLITLRNECLPLLSANPAILSRTDIVIKNASDGLVEVCTIVEKLRPEANGGKVPWARRFGWMLIHNKEFKSQEPLISRQHASVLTELNFLRTTLLTAAVDGTEWGIVRNGRPPKVTRGFDNLALLNDVISGGRAMAQPSPPSPFDPDGKDIWWDDTSTLASRRSAASRTVSSGSLSPRPDFQGTRLGGRPAPPGQSPPYSPNNPNSALRPGLRTTRSTTFDPEGAALMFRDTLSPQSPPLSRRASDTYQSSQLRRPGCPSPTGSAHIRPPPRHHSPRQASQQGLRGDSEPDSCTAVSDIPRRCQPVPHQPAELACVPPQTVSELPTNGFEGKTGAIKSNKTSAQVAEKHKEWLVPRVELADLSEPSISHTTDEPLYFSSTSVTPTLSRHQTPFSGDVSEQPLVAHGGSHYPLALAARPPQIGSSPRNSDQPPTTWLQPCWKRVRGGRGDAVWVMEDSQQLSTISSDLIYTPPQFNAPL